MNDIPNKEDETQLPEEDDEDNYSEDETKKKINTNTATTAVSSGNASEEAEKSSQAPKKLRTPAKDERDESNSEDSENDDYVESPSPGEKSNLFKGVIPKDLDTKKEMMSFIVYPQNLENACKLISCNKVVSFGDGPHEKNRIFMSGSTIMSTKLTISMQNSKRVCDQILAQDFTLAKLKRSNVLDKH